MRQIADVGGTRQLRHKTLAERAPSVTVLRCSRQRQYAERCGDHRGCQHGDLGRLKISLRAEGLSGDEQGHSEADPSEQAGADKLRPGVVQRLDCELKSDC